MGLYFRGNLVGLTDGIEVRSENKAKWLLGVFGLNYLVDGNTFKMEKAGRDERAHMEGARK